MKHNGYAGNPDRIFPDRWKRRQYFVDIRDLVSYTFPA